MAHNLRIILETHSNEERTDHYKIGDKAIIDGAGGTATIGTVKGLDLLDDHRLALTIRLESAASLVQTNEP